MSTLSLRKIKHDSSSVDNITLNSSGHVTTAERLIVNGATTNSNSNWGYYVQPKSGGGVGDFTVTRPDGNVSWLSIDSAGRVTMPYQPSFLVHADSGQGTISGGSKVGWTPNPKFIRGSTFDGANDRYTAPVSGVYWMHVVFHINSTAAPARPCFRVNGSDYNNNADATQAVMSITGSECTLILACHLQLSAGDYVEVFARAGTGSLSFYNGHTWWSGHLVG
jgi:hypothetical protein